MSSTDHTEAAAVYWRAPPGTASADHPFWLGPEALSTFSADLAAHRAHYLRAARDFISTYPGSEARTRYSLQHKLPRELVNDITGRNSWADAKRGAEDTVMSDMSFWTRSPDLLESWERMRAYIEFVDWTKGAASLADPEKAQSFVSTFDALKRLQDLPGLVEAGLNAAVWTRADQKSARFMPRSTQPIVIASNCVGLSNETKRVYLRAVQLEDMQSNSKRRALLELSSPSPDHPVSASRLACRQRCRQEGALASAQDGSGVGYERRLA